MNLQFSTKKENALERKTLMNRLRPRVKRHHPPRRKSRKKARVPQLSKRSPSLWLCQRRSLY
jgi:hypothetical protein